MYLFGSIPLKNSWIQLAVLGFRSSSTSTKPCTFYCTTFLLAGTATRSMGSLMELFEGTWPAPPYSPATAGGGAPLGFVNGCTLCPYTIFESKDWGIRVSIRETHQLQLAPAPGDLRICSSAYVSQVLHHEAHGIRKWSMQRYLMRARDTERE